MEKSINLCTAFKFNVTLDHYYMQGLMCPKLIMNPGTEVVGLKNIRHKLRNINEAIRKADTAVRTSTLL